MVYTYHNPERIWRRRLPWLLVILLVVLLLFALPAIATFVTDWLWFKELGRADVYWTLYWGPWLLGGITAVGFFALVFINILIAVRTTPEMLWAEMRDRLGDQALHLVSRTIRRIAIWGSAVVTLLVAIGVGRMAAPYWSQFLLFRHAQQLGAVDPIFHKDLGFYLFRLPIWQLLGNWLFSAFFFTLVVVVIIYLATRAIRTGSGIPLFSMSVQWHLSLLLALLLLVKAALYYLGRFSLLSATNGDFVGPMYADIHARIPCLSVMAVLAVLTAIVLLLGVARRNIVLPIGALVGLLLASILLLGVYPGLLQRFRVDPNQLVLETPYLQNHLRLTRQAYGIDKVIRQPFPVVPAVSSSAVAGSPGTVNNIRLWDYRPLQQVFSQRQALRTYYDITKVDVDRYQIGGQSREVMLAARELNTANIPGDKSWVNQHLIYTHGMGLVMSPVNEVNANKGQPNFYIYDIPPHSSVPSLQVTQPRLYFGESDGGYIVVKSGQQEFDYPNGAQNANTTYTGTAGIPLRNPFVRLLAAERFGDMNILISNYVTPQSRLVFRRQIIDRVKALAPFFSYDEDPYLVVGTDGKLYWMLDAYTTSSSYPYAQFDTLQTSDGPLEGVNYLRNPVKVVIDAYNGSVNFYLADAKEPIIRAWQQIFPTMFHPLSAMPAGLTAHVRVPEGLFNTISDIYLRYHLTEDQVNVFYQQEDLWDVPLESDSTPMEAYYVIMSLPGKREPEYLLIRPFTPHGKQNMTAWLSARSDPEHYGDLLAYDFPKESQIYGPQQVRATINQNPEISAAVSLWNQSGSQVLWGNLLVIPIDSTVLYVQPLYLQAEQSQIPELQRVILADQQHVVMRNNLADALAALTGGSAPPPSTPAPPPAAGAPPTAPATPEATALAHSALDHYQHAQDALKHNDWATYGKEMDAVRQDLEKMNKGK